MKFWVEILIGSGLTPTTHNLHLQIALTATYLCTFQDSQTFFKISSYILTIWKVLKVSVRARFNYMSQLIEQFIFPVLKHLHISLFANTIVIWDKCNCAIGQIQLQKEQESCIGCVQKSHGLKHLCVFPSLLEFQPPPIFLPIELSYCIIAMHWNGSFPRIVFLSHSFPPLITIQPAQHWHRSNVFGHFSWYTPFHFFWEILKITHGKKYTLWAPGMLWNTFLSNSYFCFALHIQILLLRGHRSKDFFWCSPNGFVTKQIPGVSIPIRHHRTLLKKGKVESEIIN